MFTLTYIAILHGIPRSDFIRDGEYEKCFVPCIENVRLKFQTLFHLACMLVTGALDGLLRNKISPRSRCFVKQPCCLNSPNSLYCFHLTFYSNSLRHFDLTIEFITFSPPC